MDQRFQMIKRQRNPLPGLSSLPEQHRGINLELQSTADLILTDKA